MRGIVFSYVYTHRNRTSFLNQKICSSVAYTKSWEQNSFEVYFFHSTKFYAYNFEDVHIIATFVYELYVLFSFGHVLLNIHAVYESTLYN